MAVRKLSHATGTDPGNRHGGGAGAGAAVPVPVPVRRILDKRAPLSGDAIWPEAVRVFAGGGMALQVVDVPGEVDRAASGRLVFKGLAHGAINLVMSGYVPLEWDQARGRSCVHLGYAPRAWKSGAVFLCQHLRA
jgi:hypothetical protein